MLNVVQGGLGQENEMEKNSVVRADEIVNKFKDSLGGEPSADSVLKEKNATMYKVAGSIALAGLSKKISDAFKLLADAAAGKQVPVSAATLSLITSALAYLVMPFDLVPDIIPVAGLFDDAVVLTWVFSRCGDLSRRITYSDPKKDTQQLKGDK